MCTVTSSNTGCPQKSVHLLHAMLYLYTYLTNLYNSVVGLEIFSYYSHLVTCVSDRRGEAGFIIGR